MGKGRSSVGVGLVLATLLLAGCASDAPLANLGHMTERWIAATPDPTTIRPTPPSVAPDGLLAVSGQKKVEWVNDELGDLSPTVLGSQAATITAVWSRSNRQDRYVQASRTEIVAALPGLEVPALIPEKVAYITSQLVFDPQTGELSSDFAAAFGFWSDKPYTKSRSVSQLAVLMVAIDDRPAEPVVPDTIGVPEATPGRNRCDELVDSTVQDCTPVTLEGGCPAWSLAGMEGWRLVWSRLGHTYDLFVRNAGNVDLLKRMAGSCEELAPAAPVLAGADAGEGAPVKDETNTPVEASGS